MLGRPVVVQRKLFQRMFRIYHCAVVQRHCFLFYNFTAVIAFDCVYNVYSRLWSTAAFGTVNWARCSHTEFTLHLLYQMCSIMLLSPCCVVACEYRGLINVHKAVWALYRL